MKNSSEFPEFSALSLIFSADLMAISINFIIFLNLSWNSEKFSSKFDRKIAEFDRKNAKFREKMNIHLFIRAKSLTVFNWIFEIGAVQKYVNLVDLEKCCKMSIWLQRLASMTSITTLSKFGCDFIHFIQSTPYQRGVEVYLYPS